jgi:hypothetical protein
MTNEDMTNDFADEEVIKLVNEFLWVPDWQVKSDLPTLQRGNMTPGILGDLVADITKYGDSDDEFIRNALLRRFAVAQ